MRTVERGEGERTSSVVLSLGFLEAADDISVPSYLVFAVKVGRCSNTSRRCCYCSDSQSL